MIVPAAVFTCSICGEASVNICSYCTKDACSNHRCERCKRCSDCCECEYPLSAEDPAPPEAVTETVLVPEVESPVPQPGTFVADFLTPAESSVFAQERVVAEPRVFGESSVFAPEDEEEDDESAELPEATDLDEATDLPEATDLDDEADFPHHHERDEPIE
jgi:hypothetical protein